MMFAPATKEKTRLRLALMGPSGSGKSYTALRFAHLLADGGRIAVVDTENRSASKYVGESPDGKPWAFDVANMEAPYTPKSFVEAIHGAERAGYAVLVIDSMTHMWSGRGGLLDMVDQRASASNSKSSFDAWRACKPHEREFWDAVTACKIHLIVTFRTKTEWVIQEDHRGKKVPVKIGTKAEQRDGVEYEFDVALMLDEDNRATPAKTRCPALTGLSWSKPGRDVVDPLVAWLSDGSAPAPTPAPAPFVAPVTTKPADATPNDTQRKIRAAVVELGLESIVEERWGMDCVTWTKPICIEIGTLCRDTRETRKAAADAAAATVAREDAAAETRPATPAELFRRRVEKRVAECTDAGVMDATIERHGDPDRWTHDTLTAIKAELAALTGGAA